MIVLVTNTVKPYAFDIQPVLGLPENAHFRFRYDGKRWIQPGLADDDIKGAAIVVLQDLDTRTFHPCRYVEITRTTKFGEMRYIDFRVGDYVKPESAASINELIQTWIRERSIDISKGLPQLVHSNAAIKKDAAGSGDDAWMAVLKNIKDVPMFKDFGFFRVREIKRTGKENVPVTKVPLTKHAIPLSSGETYSLEVAQYVPSAPKEELAQPFNMEITTPNGFHNIRGKNRVVGKYDLLRFVFDISPECAGKSTEIAITSCSVAGEVRPEDQSLLLPIYVEKKKWYWTWGLIAVGVILYISVAYLKEKKGVDALMGLIQAVGVLLIVKGGGSDLLDRVEK